MKSSSKKKERRANTKKRCLFYEWVSGITEAKENAYMKLMKFAGR